MHENRLIHEKSPYLLQHAHNPVDWRPWGEQAFAAARRADLPVFLSIGYSTCHWCHVMERESFEDAQAADVPEQRLYLNQGGPRGTPRHRRGLYGGLPGDDRFGRVAADHLMTPEQKPFWAGTYLPKYSRYGQPGLIDLLKRVSLLWRTEREQLLQAGDEIAAYIAPARTRRRAGAAARAAAHGGRPTARRL